MKLFKVLSIATLLLSGSVAVASTSQSMEVDAKTKNFSTQYMNTLKKGTFPDAALSVDESLRTLSNYGIVSSSGEYKGYSYYSFEPNNKKYTGSISYWSAQSDYTVIASIVRYYQSSYSETTFKKSFGKPYKGATLNNKKVSNTHIYKAGKYYVWYGTPTYIPDHTTIAVGTKKVMLKMKGYKKIYK